MFIFSRLVTGSCIAPLQYIRAEKSFPCLLACPRRFHTPNQFKLTKIVVCVGFNLCAMLILLLLTTYKVTVVAVPTIIADVIMLVIFAVTPSRRYLSIGVHFHGDFVTLWGAFACG